MTTRQKAIADYIDLFWQSHWTSPSVGQIADYLGIKSKATVHYHLLNMVRDGILERRSVGRRVVYRVIR